MSKISEKAYRKNALERRADLFNNLWGEEVIKSFPIWNRKSENGFTTMPRVMPYINQILDYLGGKGTPLSQTYSSLWFRNFDDGFIEIKLEKDLAFESGFFSSRAVTTWKGRMKRLKELGFIEVKSGAASEYQYIVVIDPFKVIRELRAQVPDSLMNALDGRMSEVGATW